MTFASGFEAGLQLRKYMDEQDKQDQATQIYNANYGYGESQVPSIAPDGFVGNQSIPTNYTKGTGFGGQETMMPKGAMSMVPGTTNEKMVANKDTVPGYRDGDVTTYPYQQGEPIQNVTPIGTSPYNTTQPVTQEVPNYNVMNGYPAGAQPVIEPKGPAMPNAIAQDESTITQDYAANAPQEVKNKLASAQTEDEYNSILNDYKKSQQPRESSFYDKTIADITSAKNKVDSNQEELARIKKTANEMRSKGLWKEAENFETKAVQTQKNYYEATNEYNKVVSKALETKAGLAQSYLNAVESGVNPEFAFNQTLIRAHALGIPDLDQYQKMGPTERVQAAQMIVDDAISTKDRLKTDLEIMKIEAKKAQFNRTLAQKDETMKMKDRWHTEDRDLKSRSLDIKAIKTNFEMANQTVKNTQKDLKMIQDRLDLIKSGAVIKDDFGNIMSPAESQREAQILTTQRTNLQDRLVAAEEHAANVRKYIPTKDLKEIEKTDKVLNNQTSVLPQENVDTIKTLFNKVAALPADRQAQQFNILKSNVEKEHPGYTLDTKGNIVEKGNVSAESKPEAKTEPKTQENVLKSFEGSPKRVKVDVTKQPTSFISDAQDAIVRRMGPVKDPITGKMITRSEFRKKYGENPK